MNLKGTGVALITPFNSDYSIDEVSLRRLVNFVIDGGVDFLVALGTTGEPATLSLKEKHRVAEIVVEENRGRLPLVLGIGGNDTSEVTRAVKSFPNLNNWQALLSVTPYYNKPSQEGLYRHYKAIAEVSVLPVILYNVPGRTAVNMSAETTVRLSHDSPNIAGIKEACSDLQQITEILRDARKGFTVLSGDDGNTLPLMSVGASGAISVIANLFPKEFSDMVRFAATGDFLKARELHLHLSQFFKLLFAEGNPVGVKACLHIRNIIRENVLRLPLTEVSDGFYKKLQENL